MTNTKLSKQDGEKKKQFKSSSGESSHKTSSPPSCPINNPSLPKEVLSSQERTPQERRRYVYQIYNKEGLSLFGTIRKDGSIHFAGLNEQIVVKHFRGKEARER